MVIERHAQDEIKYDTQFAWLLNKFPDNVDAHLYEFKIWTRQKRATNPFHFSIIVNWECVLYKYYKLLKEAM